MTYTIFIGKTKEAAVDVLLDGKTPAAIPPHILLGTGLKKPRYKKFLSDCFSNNSQLLNFLAYIHKTGKEKGSIALICTCKSKEKYHAESIKEFLQENTETLDMMLPYLFRDAGFKAEQDLSEQKPAAVLTDDDRAQIAALIREDQEKNRQSHISNNSTPSESPSNA